MYKPEEAILTPPWKVEVANPETVRLFVTFMSVAVARVRSTVPKVDEALLKLLRVEEAATRIPIVVVGVR